MSDFVIAHNLWAPWRMEFFRAPKETGCFLCRIIRSGARADAQNLVLHRGRKCLLLMNRYPYSNGHLMVVPRRHVGPLGELTAAERAELLDLACLGQRLLAHVARPHGFNLGINEGIAAGAGLQDHLHLHVVPRWTGDTNFMPLLGQVRVVPQALAELWAALRAALAQEKPRRGPSKGGT